MNSPTEANNWPSARKVAFRFLFLLFILIIIIENNGAFPLWDLIMNYPLQVLHVFIPWVGRSILHLPYEITVFTNGSGDTTYDYVVVLAIFITSLVGTIIWSIFDRKRANYSRLYYWFTVAVRFYVGLMLINYGFIKIIKLQFPDLALYRLIQPYGHSSPMGLAWTFLGYSKGYNIFMGLAEASAILLLFRRTMTIGAIVALGTTGNVMAINYFYDIPVKIISTVLFLMAFFLFMNDGERLYRFFVRGEQVSLPVIPAPVVARKWRITQVIFKAIVIAYTVLFVPYQLVTEVRERSKNGVNNEFYGMYNVTSFVRAGDTIPPIVTDSTRWRHLFIDAMTYVRIQQMNDSMSTFAMNIDTTNQTIKLTSRTDQRLRAAFNYEIPDSAHLALRGHIERDSVSILMFRFPDLRNKFRLTSRGFHWINEHPYFR